MGDYLANLVTRTLDPEHTVRPRPRALFEPVARDPHPLGPPLPEGEVEEQKVQRKRESPLSPGERGSRGEGSKQPAIDPHPLGPRLPQVGEGTVEGGSRGEGSTQPSIDPHPKSEKRERKVEPESPLSPGERGFRGEGSTPQTAPTELTATGPDPHPLGPPLPAGEGEGMAKGKSPLSPRERGFRGEGPRGKEPTETEAAPSPPAPAIRPREVTPALPREPDAASKTSTAEPPVVRVTIGRVEIRAASPKPTPPIQRAKLRRPAVSLADYLERRNRGRA